MTPRTEWTDARVNDLVKRLDRTMERQNEALRDLRAEMRALRGEMRSEIGGLRREMRGEVGGLRGEMGGLGSELRTEIGGLRTEIRELRRDGVLATAALLAAIVGTGVLT
jgi:hypothetical protein